MAIFRHWNENGSLWDSIITTAEKFMMFKMYKTDLCSHVNMRKACPSDKKYTEMRIDPSGTVFTTAEKYTMFEMYETDLCSCQ